MNRTGGNKKAALRKLTVLSRRLTYLTEGSLRLCPFKEQGEGGGRVGTDTVCALPNPVSRSLLHLLLIPLVGLKSP